ncbi:MAG: hypothetical protein IPI46_06910 [Bacteroidetes bacterium]|nr:hypothetical protein [Bacteroidota bacterium]
MHKALLFFFLTSSYLLQAQVQGGEHVFEFLRLAQSPHITALGSMVVSSPAKDMMLGAANPALLRPEFHTHLGINYNMYYANTKVSNVMYAYHAKSFKLLSALACNI